MYVAKTKALISFPGTAKLICVFVFAYAKSQFSHNDAHMFQNFENCSVIFFFPKLSQVNRYDTGQLRYW